MIEIKYLQDLQGADRYGTCGGCGKSSKDDSGMVRIRFNYSNGNKNQGTIICLCNRCRVDLYQKI